MSKILIVDDDASILEAFTNMLRALGHEVQTAPDAAVALEKVRADRPDLVVSDLTMPGMNGMELFQSIRELHAQLPVILMTGYGTMDTAIEATKLGAFDYQLKPVDPEAMLAMIDRALSSVRLMQRRVEINPGQPAPQRDAIIGSSPLMQEVFKSIGRVAATDATVLIRGESGTGKELIARAIYQHSRRCAAPLLTVNCVAIPETLLESELFGYERGAFTGATSRKIGKFEQADGGTIFLDEIGDLSLSAQAKLLRVLQCREIQRVGSNETLRTDVRILAATNHPLERAVAERSFREDRFYRLNVVTIELPPLRERRQDILLLVDYFLARFAMELGIGKPVLADDSGEALWSDSWPGNVRELEHCIYRAMIFTQGFPIHASDVLRARQESSPATPDFNSEHWRQLVCSFLDTFPGEFPHETLLLERIETILIEEALRRTAGNQTRAAKLLGLSRPTLHAKLRKFRISAPEPSPPSGNRLESDN